MRMKNIAIGVACLLSMAACKSEAGYKITARIAGVEDGVAVVLRNGREKVDSTVVKDGIFCFEGQTAEPFQAEISIEKRDGQWGGKAFDLFVENSDIRVDGDWKDLSELQIAGSQSEDLYKTFEKQIDPLYEKRNELQAKMWGVYTGYLYEGGFSEKCIAPGIEVEKESEALEERIVECRLDFIKVHPDSPVALKVFGDVLSDKYSEEQIREWMKLLSPALKSLKGYQALESKIAERYKLGKGKPYVDFKVVDMNGKEGMFSDYVKPGQYNMLEVWASWCGHCRVEIPHLKMVQEKYGDRFNIIAVSWDKEDAEWRKAMEEDQPGYLQLRAVKDGKGNDVGTAYGLHGIPFSLVIDGEGKIVQQEARAAALDLLLETLYGE